MLVADVALKGWFTGMGVEYREANPYVAGLSLEIIAGIVGIAFVVALGKWLGARKEANAAAAQAEPPKG
jgi:hypothetical protein